MIFLSPEVIQALIFIVLLLIASAFFSGAETAFTALSISKTELLIGNKCFAWKKIRFLTRNIDRCIMSCLILSNLVNIILSAYLTVLATSLFGLGKGVTMAVGIGTALILLFGEIIPKKIAIQYTEKFCQASAHILWGTVLFLLPLTFPITRLIQWIWPQKISPQGIAIPNISEAEIRAMVRLGGRSGTLDENSQDFLQKIFTLPKKRARDIMTPRNQIVSLHDTATVDELYELFEENHVSRIPIYTENLDEEKVYLAYLPKMVTLLRKPKNLKKPLSGLKLPLILKIPESLILQDLLILFQTKRQHLALVVNENQETIGIVTLEDVLEVVFGEIVDESDLPIESFSFEGKHEFEIDADISIDDFSTQIQQELPKKFPAHKTLAWLCMELLNRFPKTKDLIKIPNTNISLLVLSVENKKAKKISVQIKEEIVT